MDKHHYIAIFITLIVCFLVLFSLFNVESKTIDNEKSSGQYNIKMILKAKANPPDFWRIVEQELRLPPKNMG